MGICLTVMGIDFDDGDFGFKEEDKSSLKVSPSRIQIPIDIPNPHIERQ